MNRCDGLFYKKRCLVERPAFEESVRVKKLIFKYLTLFMLPDLNKSTNYFIFVLYLELGFFDTADIELSPIGLLQGFAFHSAYQTTSV